jgi:hypothetical protein
VAGLEPEETNLFLVHLYHGIQLHGGMAVRIKVGQESESKNDLHDNLDTLRLVWLPAIARIIDDIENENSSIKEQIEKFN